MQRIGLTGGIGSGKSTVAARLRELGAIVIDADALAREVVALGTPGLDKVVARFGTGVLRPDGSLDRSQLGRVVFADESALADLNGIVHPLVAERTEELMATAGDDVVAVYDVPLLVENGLQQGFDAVIVVEAPSELRLQRLARRGLAPGEAQARMDRQAGDEQRRAVASVVLDNAGSVEELKVAIDGAWEQLTGRAARPSS